MIRSIDLKETTNEKIELGRDGVITLHVADNAKRLLIAFDVDADGLSKAGVNGLIDALKTIREKMKR